MICKSDRELTTFITTVEITLLKGKLLLRKVKNVTLSIRDRVAQAECERDFWCLKQKPLATLPVLCKNDLRHSKHNTQGHQRTKKLI